MATNGIKLVFGGAILLSGDVDEGKQWLSVLEETGVNTIDLAEIYGSAEEGFGNAGAAARFTIDTKMPGGFADKPANEENVVAAGHQSLKKLQTDSIDIYYVHAPDRKTPIKETLAGLNKLHKEGAFKRLGLSNFSAEEVDEAFRVAKENGFVAPSVYQGNYSAVARRTETELFPTLRKHDMSFYAYSPIAGGLLAKSRENLTQAGGRFDPKHPFGGLYNGMYNKPSFLSALDAWAEIAEAENITRAELAYRWVVYHSKLEADKGDAVIIGASKYDQLRGTVKAIKAGPLRDESVRKIEKIWDTVKQDSVLDNYEFNVLSKSS